MNNNRLVFVKHLYVKGNNKYGLFECSCGNLKEIRISHVKCGDIKSCGCLNKEIITKHGMSGTNIYKRWEGIQKRCNNIKFKQYKDYGGRGIKCEWNSFEDFYKDMGGAYQEGLTLDRINNDGNYSKENCRWTTMKQQSRNKRSNIMYQGKCITDWCKKIGINRSTVYCRIRKQGMNIKDALFTKLKYSDT